MKKLIILIVLLILSGCMSVADLIKAQDLLNAQLAPYRAEIEKLNQVQQSHAQAITLIDEKAKTGVIKKDPAQSEVLPSKGK